MNRLSAAATKIALALALFAFWPAAAQEVSGADRILAEMPKELGGAPAQKSPNGMLMYMIPGPGGDPTIIVALTVMEKEGFVSPQQMRILALDMLDDFGMRRVVREGAFTTPKWPDAPTFFGEYVTDKGFTQSWTLATGKEAMTVLTIYANKKDAKRAEAMVAENIFGAAVISASKPAE
jgi:hypothetical protein